MTGLAALWDIQVLVALLIGSIGGVLIGAVPGIGPAIAIAILLPATLFLPQIVGLVLLLGVYGSSMYGGAIPAILINTPGTPVNALTTYDGYSMTRNGEANRALSLAYSASFFGGTFSILIAIFCLIVLGPYLKDFGALFGNRDILMAAVFGSVLLVFAHRQNMILAILLYFVGFMITLVGRQTTKKIDRFTFDQEWLYSGLNLIVVIIGIFAISQALYLLRGKDSAAPEIKMSGGLFQGLFELKKFPGVATASACYGTLMGIIPGVGEFVAQFFSYATARSISKDPDRFGHGAPDGLIASETSNNAVPAAAMIPLLALGVPGEALTAMMLTVFYSKAIKPGPDIFELNPDFLYSVFIALLIINIFVVIFLLFTTKYLTKVIYVPNRFLGAFILILAFIGVYSIRNSTIDCAVACVFGFLGFIMRRLNWPLVPIVLGMVLGEIIVKKLTAGASRVKTPWDLIDRPVSGGLFALICLILIVGIGSIIWERRKRANR